MDLPCWVAEGGDIRLMMSARHVNHSRGGRKRKEREGESVKFTFTKHTENKLHLICLSTRERRVRGDPRQIVDYFELISAIELNARFVVFTPPHVLDWETGN